MRKNLQNTFTETFERFGFMLSRKLIWNAIEYKAYKFNNTRFSSHSLRLKFYLLILKEKSLMFTIAVNENFINSGCSGDCCYLFSVTIKMNFINFFREDLYVALFLCHFDFFAFGIGRDYFFDLLLFGGDNSGLVGSSFALEGSSRGGLGARHSWLRSSCGGGHFPGSGWKGKLVKCKKTYICNRNN